MSEPTGRPDPRATAMRDALGAAREAIFNLADVAERHGLHGDRLGTVAEILADVRTRINEQFPPIQNEVAR